MALRIAYLGNAQAPWCTEVHVSSSLRDMGHDVTFIQEGEVRAVDVADAADGCAVLWHTQTYGLAVSGGTIEERFGMLDTLRERGIISVGYHLDTWWGLAREDQIAVEPFFKVDHLFSIDGGHDEGWAAHGINHHWLPPGVYAGECVIGTPRRAYASPVAFVGSHQGNYHQEWQHRHDLVRHLRRRWNRECRFWPRGEQVRGRDLANLYASVKVVVGDSCFAGQVRGSWSDRIPETLGRGGFLLHPYVPGIEDHYTDGEHLRLWQAGDWAELDNLIRYYLAHEDERRAIALAGHEHVKATATYAHRCQQVLDTIGLGA